MRDWIVGSAALAAFVGTSVQAQTVVSWPAPMTPRQGDARAYFPMGTQLELITRTQVSSKVNKPGDRLYLNVTESLSYRGQTVIPVGSVAVAEVTTLQRNGHVGKKGKIGIRLLYIQTPYGPVNLTGRANDEGTSGTLPSVATMAFVSILGGFFIHGTSAEIPEGTPVHAYLAEDLAFTVQSQQQAVTNQVLPDGPRLASATVASSLPTSFDPGVPGGGDSQTPSRK